MPKKSKSQTKKQNQRNAKPKSSLSKELFFVGRETEKAQILACLKANRNVLLEGPVGSGKTTLALQVVHELGLESFRIDGDSRFNEQKLTGWFDPPAVLKKGYSYSTFIAGPLVGAMQKGGVLFINELNRLPEGVQNVLLPAIDERKLIIPRLGTIEAKEGFKVVATQNPKEFVATSHLSEAILDRFELVVIDYQKEGEEVQIVKQAVTELGIKSDVALVQASVRLARMTRNHPQIRRGASVRAAIAVAEIASVLGIRGMERTVAFLTAATLALPTRIEMERDSDSDSMQKEELKNLIQQLSESALSGLTEEVEKKKI